MAHDSTERENPDLRSARRPTGARLFLLLAVLSTLLILYGTAFPFDFRFGEDALRQGWEQAHPLPWQGQSDGHPAVSDLVANVLLFLPWGAWVAADAARRGRARRVTLSRAVMLGVALSVVVEFVQLFSPTRLPAGSDVVANGVGAWVGAWVGWTLAGPVFERHAEQWKRSWRLDPLGRAAWVMAALVLLAGIAPFQPVLGARTLALSLDSLQLIPLADLFADGRTATSWLGRLSEMFWWSLAAGVIATARRASGRPAEEARAFAATLGLAIGVESVQLVFVGPVCDTGSVVVSAAGALLALAALRTRALATLRRRVIAALAAWSSAILLAALAAGPVTGEGAGLEGLVPFWSVLQEARVWALVETLARTLRFLPLGVGLFLLSPRTGPWTGATTAGLAIAAVQVLTATVHGGGVDLTDPLLAATAVGLSLRMLREWESTVGLDVDRPIRRC